MVRSPLSSALAPETIIVQSLGMERWLSMALAEHNGISANCHFPFPNHFVQSVVETVLTDLPNTSLFEPEIMGWRIMRLLGECISLPGFERLKDYLGNGSADLKRCQLARQIADLFDQYLIFRPSMMFQWEKGAATHWQGVLWRRLVEGNEKAHRGALARALLMYSFYGILYSLPGRGC